MAPARRGRLVGQPGTLSRWMAWVLLVLLPLVFSPESFRVFATAKRSFFVVMLAGLCFADRSFLVERLRKLHRKPADGIPALLVAYLAASSLWSSQPGAAAVAVLPLAAWYLGILVFQHHCIYADDVHRLFAALAIGLLLNLAFGLGQLFGLWWPTGLAGAEAPIGLVGNRNWFAVYVALLLPIELWYLLHRRSRPRTALAAVNTIVGLPLLVATWCRGAWAALAGALVMWALLRKWGSDVARLKRRVALFVVALIAVMFVLLGLSMFRPGVLVALWGKAKQRTVESRLLAYRITWRGITDAPVFGHGLASFGGDYTRLQERYFADFPDRIHGSDWLAARPFRHVHNDVLELAYEGGLVALLLALASVHYLTRRFFENAQRIPEGPLRSLSHLVFACVVGMAVASLVSFPFRQVTSAMIFMVLLAATTLNIEGGRRDPEELSLTASFGVLMACLLLVSFSLLDYLSEARRGVAIAALSRGDLERAEAAAVAAVNMNPWNGRALSALARCKVARKRLDEAEELFIRGGRHHYDHTLAYNLGVIEVRRGNREKALQYFLKAARQKPGADTLTALANAYRLIGRYDKAERTYKLALQADRGYYDAGFQMARLVARRSKREAIELLRRNIAVIKARMKARTGSARGAVYLLKSLKAMEYLARSEGMADVVSEAEKGLSELSVPKRSH